VPEAVVEGLLGCCPPALSLKNVSWSIMAVAMCFDNGQYYLRLSMQPMMRTSAVAFEVVQDDDV
jgi:hypothetical protein